MKAIILKKPGAAENLITMDIPVPAINDGEVLVQVKAISINPVDVKTRAGAGVYKYANISTDTELILGWDMAGIVTASKSDRFKVGDDVFGMVNFPGIGNAYAEFVAAPAAHLALKPENINYDDAAAATLAALTALQVLNAAGVKAGDRVLIHAAAGGVGHYAVQIAKTLGAYVIGTSSAKNKEFVLGIGADEHIDYQATQFKEIVKDIDFVLDSLGVENIKKSFNVIKPGGKITTIVTPFNEQLQEGARPKNIQGNFHMVQSNGKDMETIAGLLQSGKLRSAVSKIFDFNDMVAAHQQVETSRTIGKIVVTI